MLPLMRWLRGLLMWSAPGRKEEVCISWWNAGRNLQLFSMCSCENAGRNLHLPRVQLLECRAKVLVVPSAGRRMLGRGGTLPSSGCLVTQARPCVNPHISHSAPRQEEDTSVQRRHGANLVKVHYRVHAWQEGMKGYINPMHFSPPTTFCGWVLDWLLPHGEEHVTFPLRTFPLKLPSCGTMAPCNSNGE